MNKLKLLSLCFIFVAAFASPNYSEATSSCCPTEFSELRECEITKIDYIDDEFEPEMIITIDNDIRLLSKWYNGNFQIGEKVGIRFDAEKYIIEVITYDHEGNVSEVITGYRNGESCHFYIAL